MNKEIVITKELYDDIVHELINEMETKFIKEAKLDEDEDEALSMLKKIAFTMQNMLAYAELRKKLFEDK